MPEKFRQTFTNGDGGNLRIAVIGGGLVGALAALHLGKKGHEVDLYEFRDDIRKSELVAGRSINLALSVRGRKALAEIGLEKELLDHGIPMSGRMLHDLQGRTTIVPYDKNTKQCIFSVGRKYLNEVLLNAAEKYPNIHFNFNCKLINAHFDDGEMSFINPQTKETTNAKADLIIGCDGAYSAVRRQMLSRPCFDFSQTYIEHGYMELCIPPTVGSRDFAMSHNYLHIWPRGKFMMIALPNQDKTWTVTLFMPFENFNRITTAGMLLDFFRKYFPDAIPLIGEDRLIKDFFKGKPQPLVMIKCRPYNFSNKVLLMGDAAHAMVPFYGQGMNAGFEDCAILSKILNKHERNIEAALTEFSEARWEDAHAICDLAMYNYIEMRDLVTRKSYILRKTLDDFLFWLMPYKWVPLYNSVSFSHMPYKKCIENRKWQDKVINRSIVLLSCVAVALAGIFGYQLMGGQNNNIMKYFSYSLRFLY